MSNSKTGSWSDRKMFLRLFVWFAYISIVALTFCVLQSCSSESEKPLGFYGVQPSNILPVKKTDNDDEKRRLQFFGIGR
jgi:hypothetical protein